MIYKKQLLRQKNFAVKTLTETNMEKKLAIITEASSGIGKSYSRKFASQGYSLLLLARKKEKLLEISKNIKELYHFSIEILSCDLSDEEQIKNLEKEIMQRSNIYVLVNNAGYGLNEEFHVTPIEKSIVMINVHIIATVRLTKAVLPIMIKNNEGIIINVSSIASFIMVPKNLIYSSTKTFLNSFSISPGPVLRFGWLLLFSASHFRLHGFFILCENKSFVKISLYKNDFPSAIPGDMPCPFRTVLSVLFVILN